VGVHRKPGRASTLVFSEPVPREMQACRQPVNLYRRRYRFFPLGADARIRESSNVFKHLHGKIFRLTHVSIHVRGREILAAPRDSAYIYSAMNDVHSRSTLFKPQSSSEQSRRRHERNRRALYAPGFPPSLRLRSFKPSIRSSPSSGPPIVARGMVVCTISEKPASIDAYFCVCWGISSAR
jgi:hypothetical protein